MHYGLLFGLLSSLTLPGFRSVEAFLSGLAPEELRYHVLVHTSGSLQGASQSHPRVLSVALDGQSAVAFNGSPDQARFDTVELWRFDPARRRYEFREIRFAGGQAHVSPPNPPVCLGCHGRDPRPIWGAYPVWEGAFGAYRPRGKNADSPELQAATADFYRERKNHPRYRHLQVDEVSNQTSRNVGFLHLVQETNFQRVARLVGETPYYEAYKYAILGAEICPDALDDFLPRFLPFPLAALHWTRFTDRMRRHHASREFTNLDALFEPRGISTLEWSTVLGKLDERVPSRFSTGETGDDTSGGRAALWLVRGDSELSAHLGTRYETGYGIGSLPPSREFRHLVKNNRDLCESLAAESRRRLNDTLRITPPEALFRESQASARPRPVLETLARCQSCHDGDSVPPIPFGDAPALGAALRRDPELLAKIAERTRPDRGRGAMPPDAPLGDVERRELLEFLKGLGE